MPYFTMATEFGCATNTSGQLKDADEHALFQVLLHPLFQLQQQVHRFFYPWIMSDSSTSDGQRSGRGAKMADYIAAEALDSDGEPIQPKQLKKSRAAHHTKRSRTSCKACSKKLKLDTSIESDDKDDDFTMGSLELESSDGSTDVEAVSNAEVCHQCFYWSFPLI